VEVTVEEGFMVVEASTGEAFMALGDFTVRVVSEVFMAEVFMARAVSEAFTGAVLGIFTADVSSGFMAVAVFLVPASMDTQDGGAGAGVTPTRIGVTRTTPTLIFHITAISQS
jgi:hypothetical protein